LDLLIVQPYLEKLKVEDRKNVEEILTTLVNAVEGSRLCRAYGHAGVAIDGSLFCYVSSDNGRIMISFLDTNMFCMFADELSELEGCTVRKCSITFHRWRYVDKELVGRIAAATAQAVRLDAGFYKRYRRREYTYDYYSASHFFREDNRYTDE